MPRSVILPGLLNRITLRTGSLLDFWLDYWLVRSAFPSPTVIATLAVTAVLLIGCRSEEEYQKALTKSSQTDLEKKDLQKTIEEKDKEIVDLRIQIAALQERVAAREDQDKLDYMAMSGNLTGAALSVQKDAYLAFAAKHPSSPLAATAKNQADAIDKQLQEEKERQVTETFLQEKKDELKKKTIFDKLSHGEASVDEVRFYLKGADADKVLKLFGRPDQKGENPGWEYWQYARNRFIYDIVTGKMLGATIRFQQGRVFDVSSLPASQ